MTLATRNADALPPHEGGGYPAVYRLGEVIVRATSTLDSRDYYWPVAEKTLAPTRRAAIFCAPFARKFFANLCRISSCVLHSPKSARRKRLPLPGLPENVENAFKRAPEPKKRKSPALARTRTSHVSEDGVVAFSLRQATRVYAFASANVGDSENAARNSVLGD